MFLSLHSVADGDNIFTDYDNLLIDYFQLGQESLQMSCKRGFYIIF